MTPERWKRVEELYHTARTRPAGERAAFLCAACPDDEALRREVQSLLNERVSADGSLAELALPMAASGVAGVSPETMAGRRVGGYHLQTLLGAGGMGEVYGAHDTTLGRDVAIKILPRAFTRDPDRLARFEREARMLAALNHPNICAIYGLEEADGIRFLILELVHGETLADRIARTVGGLPLPDALAIARQIADALDAAHEKGIVHRDLKPANIKITPDGAVKVLDLGLAKAVSGDASGPDLTQSPAVTIGGTREGVILGTAAYMSPEQARGKAVDKRTDIWAFGCVLYEMLTGRVTFVGDTVADTIGKILERQPAWDTLPAATPPGVTRLLRRCLEKEPKSRLRDIGDARLEIDDARGAGTEQNERVAEVRSGRRERLAWASALALVVLIAAVSGARALRPAPTASEARLEIITPPTMDPSLAISPDGLKIVFVAQSAGQFQLWLRLLESGSARPLAGTERASRPFWSPDSRSIAFFADNKLKRMDIDGGSMKTLVSVAPVGLGGAWNSDDTIIFSTNPGRPILRISAEGGEPAATTRFESPQHRTHSFPRFLPDGRHFLFFVGGSPEARGVYIGQLDGLDTKRVFDADAPAVYAATGHLLFIREGTLLAQAFDPDRLELRGDPFPIAEHVTGGTTLSASAAGPIAYRTPSADSGQRQLVWVDRSGREIDREVYPDSSGLGPSLSRDGRRVAVHRFANGNRDIWSYETTRRTWDRITVDSGDDIMPLWSSDGTRMVFGSNRNAGRMNLYRKLLGGPPGSEELLLSTSQVKYPTDWSADARFLLYDSLDPKRGADIWALPLEADRPEGRKPFEIVQTDFNERNAQFSPDGTWIAYQSDKTGRFETYVQLFPGPGGESRVSVDGGAQVRWNANGKELFYIAMDDRLMAVPIHFGSNGKAVEPGTPLGLFATNVGSTVLDRNRQQYAVSPDGQSFVMNSVLGEASTSPITVILNWKPKR